jgi:hypothetical protein
LNNHFGEGDLAQFSNVPIKHENMRLWKRNRKKVNLTPSALLEIK